MYLEIISPNKSIFEGEVYSVTFPGIDGSFQVLNRHAPLITTLGEGQITYLSNKEKKNSLLIRGGVVEVLNNKVITLVELDINKN